jgi:hypothetical protein
MRSLFTILFLVIALSQPSPLPLNGSHQQEPPQKRHEVGSVSPATSPAPVVNNQTCACKQENSFKAETEQRPQKPPWWDVAWSTWALVVVGIFAAYIALRTLSDIKEQTVNATKAANAAEKSANAVISAERAYVIADVEQKEVQIFVSESPAGDARSTTSSVGSIVVTFRNVGRVPCWITQKKIQFALVEKLPEEPIFDDTAVVDDFPEPVIVGQPLRVEWQHLIAQGEHVIILSAMPTKTPFAGSNAPIVYGVIKYRDVFSENRETRFGYRITGHGHLRRINSPAYNTNT